MKTPFYPSKFKRDIKLMERRGYDMKQLKEVIALLAEEKVLPDKYKDHSLKGNFAHYRECHIRPDWLLIYKTTQTEVILTRTGTHSDLFG